MKLTRGDQLNPTAKREVLASYVHRWTTGNTQRERSWANVQGAPTIPLVSDEQWLADHAFWVRNDGTLARNRRHAEPAYMAQ